jgi:hypothetical protein
MSHEKSAERPLRRTSRGIFTNPEAPGEHPPVHMRARSLGAHREDIDARVEADRWARATYRLHVRQRDEQERDPGRSHLDRHVAPDFLNGESERVGGRLSRDRCPAERGQRLHHLDEPFAQSHVDDADPLLEAHRSVLAFRENERGAEGRMPGEWKFRVRREDADAVIGRVGAGPQDECGLREVQLLRDRLHGLGIQRTRLAKHREGVAAERLIGEDIDGAVLVAGHLRATASRTSSMNASNAGSLSFGPGAPSGWY